MAGLFITFEGGEGTGKSTQVRLLAERLKAQGRQVTLTREPGGSPGAEIMRHCLLSGAVRPFGPEAEALVFASARIDHLTQTIVPALDRGHVVICDRFMDSTRVYQGHAGKVALTMIDALERVAVGTMRPDITFILDMPATESLRRMQARGGTPDRFEAEGLDFHDRLRQGFRAIAAADPARCVLIDAVAPVERVAAAIWAALEPQLERTA